MSVWSYEGKKVVVAGCYSGMGAATAKELIRLGAVVHGADIREVDLPLASYTKLDLSDPASIDAAADAMGDGIDALFNCAGLPQTFPAVEVMKVNFIGLRQWTERLVPRMKQGGAIVSIASTAGPMYGNHAAECRELIAAPDFASGVKWVEAHTELVGNGYGFSKEVLIAYTLQRAAELAKQGLRMNVTMPAPTATPMWADHFSKLVPEDRVAFVMEPMGRFSTPEEQAYPLIFLNSQAASFVNGHALATDGGFLGGMAVGAIKPPW